MFIKMDGDNQSLIVAAYRVTSRIEAIVNEEQAQAQRAASARMTAPKAP